MSFSVNHANLVLPKIINKNKEYNDRILNKIKGHKIFNKFDLQFSNKLKKIISLSEKRRSNLKTGSLLENEINNSLIQSNELSKEVLNNPLILNSKLLIKETNKLKRTNSERLLKDIKTLINNLTNSKEVLKIDLNNRKKLFEIDKEINPFSKLSKEEQLNKNKLSIINKITNDQINFKKSINSYLNQINNVYNNFNEKIKKNDLNISQLQKELYSEKRKIKFPLRKFELLYYHKKKQVNNYKNDENEFKININKLLPFTKLGILAKKNTMQNLVLNKSSGNLQKSKSLSNINNISNQNLKNIKINSKDYSNTPAIIYKQVLKNYNLENDLLEKRKSINKLVDINLPSVEEYNKIMKSKITAFKLNEYNQKNNETNSSIDNNNEIVNEDFLNCEEEEFEIMKRKKIKEEIKNLINNAQKNNNEEKLEDKNFKKAQNEYDLINLIPERQINKFTDEYSERDNFNDILNDFNEYIKNKSINKNILEQIIINYYFELNEEKKEKEQELRKLYLFNKHHNKLTVHQRKIQENLKKYNSLNNSTFESNYLNNNSYVNYSKKTNEYCYSLNNSFEKNKINDLKDKYDILDYDEKKNVHSFNSKKQFYYREFLNFKKMYEKKVKEKKN